MHKVEFEIHFLCECPLYHDFRETLYDHTKLMTNDFVTMGMQEKFVYLMKYMWREVSCYLVQSWNIRKDNLYNTYMFDEMQISQNSSINVISHKYKIFREQCYAIQSSNFLL